MKPLLDSFYLARYMFLTIEWISIGLIHKIVLIYVNVSYAIPVIICLVVWLINISKFKSLGTPGECYAVTSGRNKFLKLIAALFYFSPVILLAILIFLLRTKMMNELSDF
jgi:hypothetical protein